MSNYDWILVNNRDRWMSALTSCGVYDTYHLPEYHFLAEQQKEGTPFLFYFQHTAGSAALPLLIRQISNVEGLEDTQSFDATSVYGYPGVVTNVENGTIQSSSFRDEFQKLFLHVLKERRIIAFFTRQNPLFRTSWLFQGICDVQQMSNTVAIDLAQSAHEQEKDMTKGHRYDIRKARASGVIAYEDKEFGKIDDFILAYNETMKRNGALEYYFFSRSYYDNLREMFDDKLKLFIAEKDGVLVSASMFLITGKIIQYHLSGTPDRYLSYSGAKVILDEVRRWGTSQGYKWLHLGGGLGSMEDSLFRFKAGFSRLRFPFEVIKAILDPQEYSKIVNLKNKWLKINGYSKQCDNFFPIYRAPIIKT